jgi:hypothetical protein
VLHVDDDSFLGIDQIIGPAGEYGFHLTFVGSRPLLLNANYVSLPQMVNSPKIDLRAVYDNFMDTAFP